MGAMTVGEAYQVLGERPGCSDEEIRKSFRKLARQWHPDVNPANREQAEEKFKQINEAYDLLTNPERQAERTPGGRFNVGVNGVTDDSFAVWKAKVDAEAKARAAARAAAQAEARKAGDAARDAARQAVREAEQEAESAARQRQPGAAADPSELKAGYDLSTEIPHTHLRAGDSRTIDGVDYTYRRVVYRNNGVLTRTLVLCSGEGVIAKMEIVPGQGLRLAGNGELDQFRTDFERIKGAFSSFDSARELADKHVREFAEWLEPTDSFGDAREYLFKEVPFANETRTLLCKGNEILQLSAGEPKEKSGYRYASADTCAAFNDGYFHLREQVQRCAARHGKAMPSLSWAERMMHAAWKRADKILRDLGG